MSKELEALENIKHYDTRVGLHEDDYNIIETALKRLENYDSVEKTIKETTPNKCILNDDGSVELENANYLLVPKKEYQKKLKALEIIKEKMVIPAYILNTKNVEKYNKWLKETTFRKDWLKRVLTQEEYDLLREVLL